MGAIMISFFLKRIIFQENTFQVGVWLLGLFWQHPFTLNICHLASLFERVCHSSKRCRLLGSFATTILSSLTLDICHLDHLPFSQTYFILLILRFSQPQLPFSLSLHCIVIQKHTPHELNNPS